MQKISSFIYMFQLGTNEHFHSRVSPRPLNEFDDGHLGVVPLPWHGPEHPRVPPRPVGVPLRRRLEERVNEVLVVDPPHGLPPRVQVPPLPELDHVIDVLPDGLGADGGGLDPAVADDLGREGAQEGLALVGGQPELGETLPVSHHREGGGLVAGGGDGGGRGDAGAGEGTQGDRAFCFVCFCQERKIKG